MENKVYVLFYEDVDIDNGNDTYQEILVYSNEEEARKNFERIRLETIDKWDIHASIEHTYSTYGTDDNYTVEDYENEFSIFETGNYCMNHTLLTLQKQPLR